MTVAKTYPASHYGLLQCNYGKAAQVNVRNVNRVDTPNNKRRRHEPNPQKLVEPNGPSDCEITFLKHRGGSLRNA
jgi:hypothetical protein